ncbi:MAG TPA: energy transducer TonB [Myxococcota bacterium]|nr:energy transducer TonB [Myxococcota bacterium]HOD08619.1 energy transducer TonB [Myxococcota bacterium]HPB51118.1 energy transducer TonB [Myxococcota bacterium]HQP96071.1 energy transducer TonB [Myxococcota bacterium]
MAGNDGRSVLDRRGVIVVLSLVASLAVHAGVVLLSPRNEPPPPRIAKKVLKPVPVSIRKEQIKKLEEDVAKKPDPPKPEPQAEPPRPEPKKKAAEPPKEPPKTPPKETPKPPEQQKPPEAPPKPVDAPPPDNKPKPFVLKNVSLRGGVAVQTGEDSNLFGDPSRDATGFKKGLDVPTQPEGGQEQGGGDGGGTAKQKEQVVIKQPKALNDVKGVYPPEYRDLRRVVRIELILSIDAQGNVGNVKVKKGAEPEFNEAAIKAVRQLRFEPATKNGVPTDFNLKWVVVFIPEGN